MTKTIMMTMVLAVALSLTSAVAQAIPVTLTNPGFEGTPYDNGWSNWGETRWDSSTAHSGSHSQGQADTGGYTVGTFQDFTVSNPGWEYTYDSYVKTAGLTGGNAFAKLEWRTSGDALISAFESTKLSGTTDWTKLSIASFAPGTAAKGRVMFIVSGGGSGQDAFFDDASVSAVPEPASLLLLGSGLVGLFSISRRKK